MNVTHGGVWCENYALGRPIIPNFREMSLKLMSKHHQLFVIFYHLA